MLMASSMLFRNNVGATLLLVLLCLGCFSGQKVYAESILAQPEVREFVREMVTSHQFDEAELNLVLADVEIKQKIIDAISRPAEKVMTWKGYRKIFLTSKRIKAGRAFLDKHKQTFARAEQVYGVPPRVVAAIIGVETFYGQRMGSYRVIDALATLAFAYPPRAKFFRKQLKEFLLLARTEKQDASVLLGSYAGAMGYGQFIPSSYRAYAVDFDGDGIRDIWNNPVDAIGSVANYLAEHRWRAGEVVAVAVTPADQAGKNLFGSKLKPHLTLDALAAYKFLPDIDFAGADKVSPLLFQGEKGAEYWLAWYNFYVITRYNHSKLYALAVYQLSRELI